MKKYLIGLIIVVFCFTMVSASEMPSEFQGNWMMVSFSQKGKITKYKKPVLMCTVRSTYIVRPDNSEVSIRGTLYDPDGKGNDGKAYTLVTFMDNENYCWLIEEMGDNFITLKVVKLPEEKEMSRSLIHIGN